MTAFTTLHTSETLSSRLMAVFYQTKMADVKLFPVFLYLLSNQDIP